MAYQNNAAVARRPKPLQHMMLRDTLAATAIEFALVAFPLCLLIVGTIVSGLNLMALGVLDAATKEAGRQIQIGAIRGTSDGAVRTLICGYLSNLAPTCNSTLMIYAASGLTFGAVQAATVTTAALSPTTFAPGIGGQVVLLQVAYKSPFGLTLANIESFMLSSTTAFRNEP